MIERIVIATDGSESVKRAVRVAVDIADKFEAEVHALSIVDAGEVESAPQQVRDDLREALTTQAEEALVEIESMTQGSVVTAVREGRPAAEIGTYARENEVDVVATGTRGRHGENRFLIGSVAERVVRTCPVPVLTVRQLSEDEL